MALPLSPNTTYSAGTPPALKALDMNALQAYLAGLYVGGYTVKSLSVDGTGGAVSTATPGTMSVSAYLSGTSEPTPAVPFGTFGRGGVPLAWAYVRGSDGVLLRGYGVAGAYRAAMGIYRVALPTVAHTGLTTAVYCSAEAVSGYATISNGLIGETFTDPPISYADIYGYATPVNAGPQATVASDHNFTVLFFGE